MILKMIAMRVPERFTHLKAKDERRHARATRGSVASGCQHGKPRHNAEPPTRISNDTMTAQKRNALPSSKTVDLDSAAERPVGTVLTKYVHMGQGSHKMQERLGPQSLHVHRRDQRGDDEEHCRAEELTHNLSSACGWDLTPSTEPRFSQLLQRLQDEGRPAFGTSMKQQQCETDKKTTASQRKRTMRIRTKHTQHDRYDSERNVKA